MGSGSRIFEDGHKYIKHPVLSWGVVFKVNMIDFRSGGQAVRNVSDLKFTPDRQISLAPHRLTRSSTQNHCVSLKSASLSRAESGASSAISADYSARLVKMQRPTLPSGTDAGGPDLLTNFLKSRIAKLPHLPAVAPGSSGELLKMIRK